MLNDTFSIRLIEPKDNRAVASIIRKVMPEFGATKEGFAIHDPEVDDMYGNYSDAKSAYFVLEKGNHLYAGAGFGPLKGGEADTCELRKMYMLENARGLGYGKKLLSLCLEEAKKNGFKVCYIETLEIMKSAKALYESFGFKPLCKPMGNTGHFGCDNWYSKEL